MGTLQPRISQIVLNVTFTDTTQPQPSPVNVNNPRVLILHEGQPIAVEATAGGLAAQAPDGTYPMVPNGNPPHGMYKFAFLPTRLKYGIYNLEFRGDYIDPTSGTPHVLVVQGIIGIGEISAVQDVLNRAVCRLFDDFPEYYRLDEPIHQWSADQLFSYFRDAVDRFNNIGPRVTFYDIDGWPPNLGEFFVTGTVIWALYARARLEKMNEMNYSDVHSLNIARADFLKGMADTLLKDWEEAVSGWKKATPPKPVGLRAQRLPFRVFRVIGLLPNYQSFFSG